MLFSIKYLRYFIWPNFLNLEWKREKNSPWLLLKLIAAQEYGPIKRELIWVENADDFDWLNKLNIIIRW